LPSEPSARRVDASRHRTHEHRLAVFEVAGADAAGCSPLRNVEVEVSPDFDYRVFKIFGAFVNFKQIKVPKPGRKSLSMEVCKGRM
jgi:hypothetical protein